MLPKDILEVLARRVVELQSFDFQTFEEARCIVQVPNATDMQYEFDRLSLCVYQHDLDTDSFSYLGGQMNLLYSQTHTAEQQKTRQEYGVLLSFLRDIHCLSFEMHKETRPDFVLDNGVKIGIEITRLMTEDDGILGTISRHYFNQGKTAEQIKTAAVKATRGKAEKYQYWDLGDGVVAVGSPMIDIAEQKWEFAQLISKKYDKYKTMLNEFDEFVILCDARLSIAVTNERDSTEVVEAAKILRPQMKGLSVAIIRLDNENQTCVDKFCL